MIMGLLGKSFLTAGDYDADTSMRKISPKSNCNYQIMWLKVEVICN